MGGSQKKNHYMVAEALFTGINEFSLIRSQVNKINSFPSTDGIFHNLWDSASLALHRIVWQQCFHCYTVGGAIKYFLKEY